MSFLEPLARDMRQSVRNLARDTSFTATALLILALCLGANVAIFAVVDSFLLEPLPFRDPHQLVTVYNSYPKAGIARVSMSVPIYLDAQRDVSAFQESGAIQTLGVTLIEAGSAERLASAMVTPSFFRVLGVNASLGRTFRTEEAEAGKNQAVILSDGFWRQRFGASPSVVGRTLRLDSKSYIVVGVMPAGFRYLSQPTQVWLPLVFSAHERLPVSRHSNTIEMIAHLRAGTTVEAAQAQLDAMNETALKTDVCAKIVTQAGFHGVVHNLQSDHVAQLRPLLLLLQGGALFLLVIGVVNVANLLLVRSVGRAKEYGVRQALGASRFQLSRALAVETVILAVTGGWLGVMVGSEALEGIAALASDRLPLAIPSTIDAGVWLTVLIASAGLGLVLALPVVWQTLHRGATAVFSPEARGGTATRQVHRVRHALIVAQIALAFVLLAGSGLLGLSFVRVLSVNPGFRPDHILTANVDLPAANYREANQRMAFAEKLAARLQGLPGVVSVGIGTGVPFTGLGGNHIVSVEGRALEPGESVQGHAINAVTGNYFETFGLPLIEGRFLESDDAKTGREVCVIDENAARTYWPKGGALGHRLWLGSPDSKNPPFTIVGVVGPVKQDLAEKRSSGAVYFPYARFKAVSPFTLAVRSRQAPDSIATTVRAAVLQLDPALALFDVKTMAARLDDSLANRRLPLLLAAIFAGVALVLAAAGIYGVLAYSVMQRRREIGIRLALGADRAQILRQFLALGGRLLVVGLPLGLIGAWFAGRGMAGLLFGVGPTNVIVLAGTAFILALVAMLACLLPARRAARVEPNEALRME